MTSVRIAALKDHLSRHLRSVQRGKSLTVLDRDTPIARIVPYAPNLPALVVHRAKHPWHKVKQMKMPPRPRGRTDSLSALLEERGER